ncbi:MAG TPA: YXWGXW repeat-containing protein [Chitinivibrionales bacterium]|nr:YXWGXW repeat-containing protein [Chitinivibrionales bacterium]
MRTTTVFRTALVSGLVLCAASLCAAAIAVDVSIRVGPPPLPVYSQPVCPGPGYLWMPGYWAYGPDGYYWVPGTWVMAPRPGLLWTPGYWGWSDGVYLWHEGYWARHVGFYGGISYGFGYTGTGFVGGYWREGVFSYNRSVTNVNVTMVHNTYTKVVDKNVTVNRVSFNGGTAGTHARPNAAELAAARERHVPPTVQQTRHCSDARGDRTLLASENHGQPPAPSLAKHAAWGPGGERGRIAASEREDLDERDGHQKFRQEPRARRR